MRMRAERSGRDGPGVGPGPALRGGHSINRERSFNDRDERRPMVMSDQVSLPSEKGVMPLHFELVFFCVRDPNTSCFSSLFLERSIKVVYLTC